MSRFRKFASMYFSRETCVIFGSIGAGCGFYNSISHVNKTIIDDYKRYGQIIISPGELVVTNLLVGFFGVFTGAFAGVALVPGIPMLIFALPVITKTYYDNMRIIDDTTETNGNTGELK